jgi:hypothetical protein
MKVFSCSSIDALSKIFLRLMMFSLPASFSWFASSNADIWVAATDVANQLKDAGKENIISLKNIFDKASIEEQLKTFM